MRRRKKVEDKIDKQLKKEGKTVYTHPFQTLNEKVNEIIPEIIKLINGIQCKVDTDNDGKKEKLPFASAAKNVFKKFSKTVDTVKVQLENSATTKSKLIEEYTSLKKALEGYIGTGINQRFALLDSPHSLHRISGVKKALAIVNQSLEELQGTTVFDTEGNFSPMYLNN